MHRRHRRRRHLHRPDPGRRRERRGAPREGADDVDNQALGVLAALDAARADPAALDAIVHGTTTTTNAMLERKIAKRRPDHDARLSRRARARPAHAADAIRPDGSFVPLIARSSGSRSTSGSTPRARCSCRSTRRRSQPRRRAARGRRRERRRPLPAQLHQRRARGERRRDRARAVAEPLRDGGPHRRRRVPRVRARHDRRGQRRDPAGAAPLYRAPAPSSPAAASRASCW